jgi:hypothetical protein
VGKRTKFAPGELESERDENVNYITRRDEDVYLDINA